MLEILDNLVHTVNSVGTTCFTVFSSFITVNYYVGDILFNCIKAVYLTCFSALCTLFVVLQILLEDLIVFFQELSETLTDSVFLLLNCFDLIVDFISSIFAATGNTIGKLIVGITSCCTFIFNFVAHCLNNFGDIFNLIGKSIILLINLVPRTIYLLYAGSINLVHCSKQKISQFLIKAHHTVTTASPELLLGIVVGTLATLVIIRYIFNTIRERNITWRSLLRGFLWLICSTYIFVFRSIARCVCLTLTVMEMTVSNLRVPMFAHAGDSDDEDEDRENLVGAVEDSDDEENERRATKRRNYEMLLEKANKRHGHRRGSEESVEDQLLREVEREREDKLCSICLDQEKCIMMLPCRHLCICATCQEHLRTQRNICPICRKQVKQMIKAYL